MQLAGDLADARRQIVELSAQNALLRPLRDENAELRARLEQIQRDNERLAAAEAIVTELHEQLREMSVRELGAQILAGELTEEVAKLQQDLAKAEKQRDRIRNIALIDPDTSIQTRFGLKEWSGSAIRAARRQEALRARNAGEDPQPLQVTIIFQDAEKFKAINDKFGHAAGDRVIGIYGRAWRAALDPNYLSLQNKGFVLPFAGCAAAAARFGGDETVIVAIGPFNPSLQIDVMSANFKAIHKQESALIQKLARTEALFRLHPHRVRVAVTSDTLPTRGAVKHVFSLVNAVGAAIKADDVRVAPGRADFTELTEQTLARPDDIPTSLPSGELYVMRGIELAPDLRGVGLTV